ncbi:transposase [Ligilactobacillus equi]|uniref:IS701 family transposase n=1 Tax=Ligilactobacillus equi TaxID=137357 RepID=UPI002ED578C6
MLFFADDTIQPKYGTKFEYIKILHDHAMHTGKLYVNGHCFVALTVAFPMIVDNEGEYFMFPFAMRMYGRTNQSKLGLVYEMAERALKFFNHKQRIILACDSWYPKGKVLDFITKHRNVDLIANIRRDSALFTRPTRTGKRSRPRKYGDKFSISDIALTDDNGSFKAGMVTCLTKLFDEPVHVIRTQKGDNTDEKLFLSTIDPKDLPELSEETIGL